MYSYINIKAMSTTSDETYFNFLTEGITGNQWGYGIRRVTLKSNPDAPELVNKVPYTYTSSGFKSQEGNWFVGVRMNVDQCSPQKMRPFNQYSNIHQLWGEMMLEFAQEYAHKNNQISY